MKKFANGTTLWANKHQTFVEKIKELFSLANDINIGGINAYNDTTKGLQQIISDAIKSNTPIRSLGAGWSWTKIATVADGNMMDTKLLNGRFPISQQSVVPTYKGDTSKLLFAQCGMGVKELNDYLQPKKLSLKTSGASNGQTIAGAIATGAHGSAFDFGAVQDFVVGLHIIVGPNRHIYLERKSYPVVAASFIQKIQTELIQDDDLFNAALVSMGAFGIIHGVMVETEPIFLLETYMQRMPYDDSLKKIISTLDFSTANLPPHGNERPFHFSVQINPYDLDNGAYVTTMYKRDYPTPDDYKRPATNPAGIGPGDDAASFVGKLTQKLPETVPFIVNKLLGGALTPSPKKPDGTLEPQLGSLGEIFDNTTLTGKLLSAAIGIPISVTNTVVDLFFAYNNTNGPFVGMFALRFIKKSNATLAFTRFEHTCVFELDAAFSNEMLRFYTGFWALLEQQKIPFTFHWGKMNEYTPARIATMYGASADAWIAARNKLLDADCLKVFTNPIMQQWGIDKVL